MDLPIDVDAVPGFMHPDEGHALFEAALSCASRGAILEVGTYCGKSAVYIGTACQQRGGVLFTVDHHRGSEENQPGWEYFDETLWDDDAGALDTLPMLRATLRRSNLEGTVIPIIGNSQTVGRYWQAPLSMLFIDGGHTLDAATTDYRVWTPKIMPGGILAIHDVFPDPKDGGRPPFEIYQLVLKSGLFAEIQAVESLRLLRRLG